MPSNFLKKYSIFCTVCRGETKQESVESYLTVGRNWQEANQALLHNENKGYFKDIKDRVCRALGPITTARKGGESEFLGSRKL